MVNCAMSRREKEFWEKQPFRPAHMIDYAHTKREKGAE